jgi:hypothetical protein
MEGRHLRLVLSSCSVSLDADGKNDELEPFHHGSPCVQRGAARARRRRLARPRRRRRGPRSRRLPGRRAPSRARLHTEAGRRSRDFWSAAAFGSGAPRRPEGAEPAVGWPRADVGRSGAVPVSNSAGDATCARGGPEGPHDVERGQDGAAAHGEERARAYVAHDLGQERRPSDRASVRGRLIAGLGPARQRFVATEGAIRSADGCRLGPMVSRSAGAFGGRWRLLVRTDGQPFEKTRSDADGHAASIVQPGGRRGGAVRKRLEILRKTE